MIKVYVGEDRSAGRQVDIQRETDGQQTTKKPRKEKGESVKARRYKSQVEKRINMRENEWHAVAVIQITRHTKGMNDRDRRRGDAGTEERAEGGNKKRREGRRE